MQIKQVITLNDDSTATIFGLKDILDLVEFALGPELAELLEDIFHRCELNEIFVKEKLQTDLEAYEVQLDYYNSMLLDIVEVLNEICTQMLSGKRINKQNVADILKSLSDQILQNI